MYEPKKQRQLSSGTDVLQALFEDGKSPLSEQFLRWKLWKKWPEFVGQTIAEVSEPVGYRRGTLYVWVKNSTWMQQLIFMLEPIQTKINQKLEFKYVKLIHLTLDRKSVPHNPEEADDLKKHIAALMSQGDD